MLVSSATKTYTVASGHGGSYGQTYEAQCIDEKGLLLQRNVQSGTLRRIRATPVGPDGMPHFEYLDNGDVWYVLINNCGKPASIFSSISHVCPKPVLADHRF